MPKKTFNSVAELARGLSETPALADEVASHLAQRQVVHKLLANRAARELTQKDLAEKLGCTQSRVSKLESSTDMEWSLQDLIGYADALGLKVAITLAEQNATAVDEVKHHAFHIKKLTDHLAHRALIDQAIADGIAGFFNEAAVNLSHILQASAKQPPQTSRTTPGVLTLDTCGLDDDNDE